MSSEKWSCKEGCDLSKGVICPHLEDLLPRPSRRNRDQEEYSIDPLLITSQQRQDALLYHMSPEKEAEFVVFLKAHGLDEIQRDILLDRFVLKLGFREIAKKYGYVSADSAHHLYVLAVDQVVRAISWRKKHAALPS